MIFGDPFKFCVVMHVVELWNIDNSFNNGIMFIGIDGKLFLPEIENITLNVEIDPLIKRLGKVVVDEEVFYMDAKDAVKEIYKHWVISNDNIDDVELSDREEAKYRDYDITPLEYRDCLVFRVCNEKDEVRFLGVANLKYNIEESVYELDDIEVAETIISSNELDEVIKQLQQYRNILIGNY